MDMVCGLASCPPPSALGAGLAVGIAVLAAAVSLYVARGPHEPRGRETDAQGPDGFRP